jgi:hypothetical protein
MGAGQSSLPWRDKSPSEIAHFWDSFPRVIAMVSSVARPETRDLFFVPLLIKKLAPNLKNYPIVTIDDKKAWWSHSGNIEKNGPTALRIRLVSESENVSHAVSAILRWHEDGNVVSVQWLDSSLETTMGDLRHFEEMLKLHVPPNTQIKMDTILDDSCPKIQYFSGSCAVWSLLLIAMSIQDETETGAQLLRSKSFRAFSDEFRAFIAWMHDDLLEGQLLQEQIFLPECDKKLVGRDVLNTFAVDVFSHYSSNDSKVLSHWANSKSEETDWLFEAISDSDDSSGPSRLILLLYPGETFNSLMEFVGSDLWDPSFEITHKQCEKCEGECKKCGNLFCVSTNKSYCRGTKPSPNPNKFWVDFFKENGNITWLNFVDQINPKLADKIENLFFRSQ